MPLRFQFDYTLVWINDNEFKIDIPSKYTITIYQCILTDVFILFSSVQWEVKGQMQM